MRTDRGYDVQLMSGIRVKETLHLLSDAVRPLSYRILQGSFLFQILSTKHWNIELGGNTATISG